MNNLKNFVCAANGTKIWINDPNFIKHMEAHSDVASDIIAEAIKKIQVVKPFGFYTIEVAEDGYTNCVEITDEDDVRLVKRKGRDTLSRVVFNKQPKKTNLFTIGICLDTDDNKYKAFTAFWGELAPKEPTDPSLKDSEKAESEAFWACHALVYDPANFD